MFEECWKLGGWLRGPVLGDRIRMLSWVPCTRVCPAFRVHHNRMDPIPPLPLQGTSVPSRNSSSHGVLSHYHHPPNPYTTQHKCVCLKPHFLQPDTSYAGVLEVLLLVTFGGSEFLRDKALQSPHPPSIPTVCYLKVNSREQPTECFHLPRDLTLACCSQTIHVILGQPCFPS